MSNPHVNQTLDGLDKMHEVKNVSEAMALAAVQAQATLAVAHEQRTANLLAFLHPVEAADGKAIYGKSEAILKTLDVIAVRLGVSADGTVEP